MFTRARAFLDVATTLLVLFVIVAALWRTVRPNPGAPAPIATVSGLRIDKASITKTRGTGPIALVEFSDFQCPYCGQYARDIGPRIDRTLVQSGKIRMVFFNYPLPNHPQAQKAGEAAECAGNQGHFWQMHDALFGNQHALDLPAMTSKAERLGLNVSQFDTCLNGNTATDNVHRDFQEGQRLGVTATPAFFVGRVQADGSIALERRITGAVPFEDFQNTLQEVAGGGTLRQRLMRWL